MANAGATVMDLIFGRWRSQILYAGVKLGLFEALGDEPQAAGVVGGERDLDPALTYRLLRALGAVGLVYEDTESRFSLTQLGRLLRADHPETLQGIALLEEGPEHYAIWRHLPDLIHAGRQNAFVREFGRNAFEHAAAEPGYGEVFDAAMTSYSRAQTAWVLEALENCDLSRNTRICDVGGGRGHMLCSLLVSYPHLEGIVLERPEVIADPDQLSAEPLGVRERCSFVAGDMFAEVPSADVYTMKLILHDWSDDACVDILKTLARSAPVGGRVLVIEHVVPGPEDPHFAKLFDIHMMCWGDGRERTSEEYGALMHRAGWRPVTTHYPNARMIGVVEGCREAG